MSFFLILPYYLLWHYGEALKDIKNILKNFILFIYNFFSISLMLQTFFSPWERIADAYGNDPSSILQTFIFNTIMRAVGVTLRFIFIVLGLVFIFLLVLFGIIFYAIWLFLPLILINFTILGTRGLDF